MIDTEYFKGKLEGELKTLEEELKTVGRINPNNKGDWEAIPEKADLDDPADKGEAAENITEFEENTAILKQLEIRYNNTKDALERIKSGTYGICEIGGEEIEKEKLDANPSTTTCKAHINDAPEK